LDHSGILGAAALCYDADIVTSYKAT